MRWRPSQANQAIGPVSRGLGELGHGHPPADRGHDPLSR